MRRWEAWELTELRERWHLEDPEKLAAKLGRTVVALRTKACDLGLSAAHGPGHYSLEEAAQALGIGVHSMWRLIDSGRARSIKGRLRHWLTIKEVERLERDLLREGPENYMRAPDVARRLGYHRSNITALCRRKLLAGVLIRRVWWVPVAQVEQIERDLARTGSLRGDWRGRSPEHAAYCAKMAEAKRERIAAETLLCVACGRRFHRRKGSGRQSLRCEACRLIHKKEARRAN